MLSATVITDASWCPRTHVGGWAAWIAMDGNVKIKESGPFKNNPTTSVEAEYWAALNGLYIAGSRGAEHFLVQTDCMDVVRRLNNIPRELSVWCDENHINKSNIRARHVKGHTNDTAPRSWVNRWCDREARKHMRKLRGKKDSAVSRARKRVSAGNRWVQERRTK